ncbi:unnamed protein product [Mytilus edulis]|uniref:Uncharacterized protein n=1 Tax=Mytilus edulis TaxID=6550 RepID=A0A8S3TZR1_MYTED|nr:unnamed protein product [Mytilus edulis]
MEYFKIVKRFKRGNQDLYRISEIDGDENMIKGTFYRYELQKIDTSETDTYKIEKIIKRKKINGTKHVLVKWKNTKNQTGRGMYGRYRGSYMISVNQNTNSDSSPVVKTQLVSPVEATQQRAESQMKEERKLDKPRVELIKSLFSHIDVYMNNKLVSINSNNFPWKAYLKVVLSSGKDEQESQLQSQLFMKDNDPMDSVVLNSGFVNRYEFTKESRTFELEGNLLEDTLNLEARVKLDPGVILNHRNQIRQTPAKYVINRSNVIQNIIPKGSTEFYWDGIFPKAIPSKLVFGLLSQTSVNGDYTKNPFNFQHFNMTEVSLKVNGVEIYGTPLKLDFGVNRNYSTAYVRLFEISEKWNKDAGLNISYSDFGAGYSLLAFSLDPSLDFQEDFINLVKHGNARLEIRFKSPTTETINCLCYYQSQAILTVDESREVRILEP